MTDEKRFFELGKRMYERMNTPGTPPFNPYVSKREWVGLTLDDIPDLAVSKDWIDGARWAATLLWEKNND